MSCELETNKTTNSTESDPEDPLLYLLAILQYGIQAKQEMRRVDANKQRCDDAVSESQRIIDFVEKELEQSKNEAEPDQTSFNAAKDELDGKQVPAAYEQGRPYDHVTKVHEKVRALEKRMIMVDREINQVNKLEQGCQSDEALDLLNDGRLINLQDIRDKLASKIEYYRKGVPEGSQIDKEHAENLIRLDKELKLKQKIEEEEMKQAELALQNTTRDRLQEAMKKTLTQDAPSIAITTIFREIGLILSDLDNCSSFSQAYDRILKQLLRQLSTGCSASFLASYLKKPNMNYLLSGIFTSLWTLKDGLDKGSSWKDIATSCGKDLLSSSCVTFLAKKLNRRYMVVSATVSSLVQSVGIVFDRNMTFEDKLMNVGKVTATAVVNVGGIYVGEVIGTWVGGALGTTLGPAGAYVGMAVGAVVGGFIGGTASKCVDWLFS